MEGVLTARELDLVAGIWVLSCLDEDSTMTYLGIESRLGIDAVDAKALVGSRPDLFRPGISERRLKLYRERHGGKLNADGETNGLILPAWLASLPKGERRAAIERLSPQDFFRNQFRVESEAPKTSIETINFGLNYISDLRNAAIADMRRAGEDAKLRNEIEKIVAETSNIRSARKWTITTMIISALALVVSAITLLLKIVGTIKS